MARTLPTEHSVAGENFRRISQRLVYPFTPSSLKFLALLLLFCARAHLFGQTQSPSNIAVITNRASSLPAVRRAMQSLEAPLPAANFWISLANQVSYSVDHRRLFLLHLFRQHVRPDNTLGEIQTLLKASTWIQTNAILEVTDLTGAIPIRFPSGDTVFVIQLLPQTQASPAAVYLRVTGSVALEEFRQLFSQPGLKPRVALLELQEIGFSDPWERN